MFKRFLLSMCLLGTSLSPCLAQSSFPLTEPFLYSHISTKTTTVVKTGPGVLHTICVNTKGASSDAATIYDGVDDTGSVIAVLDTTTSIGCLQYDTAFIVGLTVITATGTAGDITVSFK